MWIDTIEAARDERRAQILEGDESRSKGDEVEDEEIDLVGERERHREQKKRRVASTSANMCGASAGGVSLCQSPTGRRQNGRDHSQAFFFTLLNTPFYSPHFLTNLWLSLLSLTAMNGAVHSHHAH